jgi:hypothetical protein
MKQAELQVLPTASISLDKENPRIKQYLEYFNNVTADAIAMALSDSSNSDTSTTFRVLRDSIKESGGIIHPIIVNHEGDGSYVVIEGNTRLQIYRDFERQGTPGDWTSIIALVYENLSDIEKHEIRLQSHLVGPREWDPYSKAKYLYHLSEEESLPMNTIISMCGGGKTEIEKSIEAYKYMRLYYAPYAESHNYDFDVQDFSKFREHENPRIKSIIQRKGFAPNDFAKWVVDGNIDRAQGVRDIPAIFADDEAREVFLKENLKAAMRIVDSKKVENEDLSKYPYHVLANALCVKLNNILHDEIVSLATETDEVPLSKREALERLKMKLDFIINEIKSREES